jgi:hypothetical protein
VWWFLSWIPWERVVSNRQAIEPRVPSGYVEVSLWKFYGRHHYFVNRYPVTEYLCHKWPWTCFVRCDHYPVISSFMTYHRGCNKSNTTCPSSKEGTAYPSGAPEFPQVFSGVRFARSYVFCVVCCRFVLLPLFFWSLCCLLPFTASDYPVS